LSLIHTNFVQWTLGNKFLLGDDEHTVVPPVVQRCTCLRWSKECVGNIFVVNHTLIEIWTLVHMLTPLLYGHKAQIYFLHVKCSVGL